MATKVIMPALGMAQETGVIVNWLKAEGEMVTEGEPLMEIETDKVTAEIEGPASGVLTSVTAEAGDEIPVGQIIAWILAPGESTPETASQPSPVALTPREPVASPVAARVAADHNIDLSLVKARDNRITKADVLAYIEEAQLESVPSALTTRQTPASPKARRLAAERGLDIAAISGSGPTGEVLAADVPTTVTPAQVVESEAVTVSTVWRVMAERVTQSWTSVPHFYLLREVSASRLIAWRETSQRQAIQTITYTDLLVKLVAAALRDHPRLNSRWHDGVIIPNDDINVGLAVAVEQGLMVPVVHLADERSLNEIATRRKELVSRAQDGKLRSQDIEGGTFTISNLGMYGVDAFSAIINSPQAAILAVGRIAERVVPVNGQPVVQPMMMLSLSCDHRLVDGARGAQFLDTLANLIEEPLGLLQ